MNAMKYLSRLLRRSGMTLGAAILVSGCVSLPKEVKESVDETRALVAQIHRVHAQDARAFARLVEQRESYLKESASVLRRAFRAKLEAEVTASKTKTMAEFDRRAAEELGIHFQTRVRRDIVSKFDPFERQAIATVIDARNMKTALANDPGLAIKVVAKERHLFNLQGDRENLISTYFLSLEAALRTARAKFETEIDEQYNEKLNGALEAIASAVPNADDALEDFTTRMSARISQLDDAYYSIDHALSDLSTFLDSEATSSRFIKHSVKGFAAALMDDLKGGQSGGVALSEILGKQGVEFGKSLKQIEASMLQKTQGAVTDVMRNITAPPLSRTETTIPSE